MVRNRYAVMKTCSKLLQRAIYEDETPFKASITQIPLYNLFSLSRAGGYGSRSIMLTPPYHFSIVACPPIILQDESDPQEEGQILYRGAIPSIRSFPFLKRLNLKTVICLQKKPVGEGEALSRWAKKHKVEVVWQKVDKMTEESLGMTRNQVSDIIKTILDPSHYPLYIADKDGISHTTLLVSCLRKLQGWTPESILDEIIRFEPDHEDMPLVPFITSYLASGPSSETLTLPTPPFPSWLWPTTIQGSTGISDKPGIGISHSRSNTSLSSKEGREQSSKSDREKEKDKERDRSVSAPAIPGTLPFPHPLTARKHPTMKISFPMVTTMTSMPPPPVPLSTSTKTSSSASPDTSTSAAATTSATSLSRVSSRREPKSRMVSSTQEDDQSLMAAATSILSATLVTLGVDSEGTRPEVGGARAIPDGIRGGGTGSPIPHSLGASLGRVVSRMRTEEGEDPQATPRQRRSSISIAGDMLKSVAARLSPSQLLGGIARSETSVDGLAGDNIQAANGRMNSNEEAMTSSPEPEDGEEDDGMEMEETETEDDEDEDEEDDDDDDDDDRGLPPTSLHISALDLAGYG